MTVYNRLRSTYKKIIQGSIVLFLIFSCHSNEVKIPNDKKMTIQNGQTEKASDNTNEKIGLAASTIWTEQEKANWLKPCMMGIKMIYGEESAKNTCDCMLKKMQEKHKVYSEVDKTDPDESSKLMVECLDVNTDIFVEN